MAVIGRIFAIRKMGLLSSFPPEFLNDDLQQQWFEMGVFLTGWVYCFKRSACIKIMLVSFSIPNYQFLSVCIFLQELFVVAYLSSCHRRASNASYWMVNTLFIAISNFSFWGFRNCLKVPVIQCRRNFLRIFIHQICCLFEAAKQRESSHSVLSKDATTWPGCGLSPDHMNRVVKNTTRLPLGHQSRDFSHLNQCFSTFCGARPLLRVPHSQRPFSWSTFYANRNYNKKHFKDI